MIGVLASSLNPDKRTKTNELVGSALGSREFVKAMSRCLPPPSVALIVPDQNREEAERELRRLVENEGGAHHTAKVAGYQSVSSVFSAEGFIAAHNLNPSLHEIAYLRTNFAKRIFPVSCTIHGLSYPEFAWEIFTRTALTPLLNCDSVICTSLVARDAYLNRFEQAVENLRQAGIAPPTEQIRVDVIPLGVDTEIYRPRDKADTRRLLGLPQNKTILLYFGRIDPITKGDMTPLLSVFRELIAKHGQDIVLVLAGAGADETLKYIAKTAGSLGCLKQIIVRANPSLIEGPLYYSAADIFVSLSETLQESFGISPLEAMASGLPVVVSDWSGYRETVAEGVTGFRIPTQWMPCDSDINALAPVLPWQTSHFRISQSVAVDTKVLFDSLNRLISSPALRDSMGKAAFDHIQSRFAWECVMSQMHGLWQELATIGRTLAPVAISNQTLMQPNYYTNFKHFATRQLDGSECLEITDLGREVFKQNTLLNLHPELRDHLDPAAAVTILRFVSKANFFRFSLPMNEVSGFISRKYHITSDSALRHIMWTVKYGFLKLAKSGA